MCTLYNYAVKGRRKGSQKILIHMHVHACVSVFFEHTNFKLNFYEPKKMFHHHYYCSNLALAIYPSLDSRPSCF